MTHAPPDGTPDTAPPLAGVRVIEMGSLIAGPFCGQLLADHGAEVIKIEPPGVGDPMREWGREKSDGRSLWWPIIARNKKSITLDLRTGDGQQIARDLLADADVLLENFRPGTVEKWGLGFDQLTRINPGLVMVRVSGFGQHGPYAERPGYGAIAEAMGGLRYVVGDPSTPPSRVGISLGDSLAATFATLGTLLALRARDRTGTGQVVDAAIYEAVLALMESLVPEYGLAGFVRERSGPILPNVAPSNVYPTSDGAMVLIAANQDTVFRRLAAAMGRPQLGTDQRYASHTARGRHQAELDAQIADWTRTLSVDALTETLIAHSVPVGKIYRAPEMLTDPHFQARRTIVSVDDPALGAVPMQNVFPRLDRTPGVVRHTGPALGAHNDEIYRGLLAMTDERYARLRAGGVI
ncbi:CoA transferase [Solwaraspora sp. WMMD792]|uniref:CaiB/BaiF CoA transferase family protein n=1 Tax=Solwaraspora sp. WMMD792 TaxID=3016099 RepID=UPI002416C43A|nr:CoA transferase [Solwaraspora sp. WMMD792]MDG4771040.1 CoA transferase [Solwaraspora sp. WMMD792]